MLLQAIQTERLIVRPFEGEDWHAVHSYMSDPKVTAWLPEGPFDEAESRAFVARNVGDAATAYPVFLREGLVAIGHMPFHPWFAPRTYEVGWVLHPNHQGRGYATEAARALVAHSFSTLDAHRVIATCQPENGASWRVMEKLGMRREAHFRQGHLLHGETWWDEYFYAMLEDDWFGTESGKEIEENP